VEILLAHCLAHRRRQFVEVAQNFRNECRCALESRGEVYANDAIAREQKLSAPQQLEYYQQNSGPVMDRLHGWLEAHLGACKCTG